MWWEILEISPITENVIVEGEKKRNPMRKPRKRKYIFQAFSTDSAAEKR